MSTIRLIDTATSPKAEMVGNITVFSFRMSPSTMSRGDQTHTSPFLQHLHNIFDSYKVKATQKNISVTLQ
jgi:hypothetical protein